MAPVTSSAAKEQEQKSWSKLPLFMGSFDTIMEYDLLEIIRLTTPPPKCLPEVQAKLGNTNVIMKARDALAKDPYSMHCINELANHYARIPLYDQIINVLMRGWKRADEIPDSSVKFCFLMKLAEASHARRQYRQAFAVLQGIEEPDDPVDLLSYQILACKIRACNGDLQSALKLFKQAVDGKEFEKAVRIWALVLRDFTQAGCVEAAKTTMQKLAGDNPVSISKVKMLEEIKFDAANKYKKQETVKRWFVIAAIVVICLFVVLCLYKLEQWNLNEIKNPKPVKKVTGLKEPSRPGFDTYKGDL